MQRHPRTSWERSGEWTAPPDSERQWQHRHAHSRGVHHGMDTEQTVANTCDDVINQDRKIQYTCDTRHLVLWACQSDNFNNVKCVLTSVFELNDSF